jgi:hypothetical protein
MHWILSLPDVNLVSILLMGFKFAIGNRYKIWRIKINIFLSTVNSVFHKREIENIGFIKSALLPTGGDK